MATVLVIDDDRALTQAIRVRLEAAGFGVKVAHDSKQGGRIAISEKPDVILLDLDLPDYSGVELHECLKFAERSKRIPVVYLSGNDSPAVRAAAFRNGASDFITKPYDPATLVASLRNAMAAPIPPE